MEEILRQLARTRAEIEAKQALSVAMQAEIDKTPLGIRLGVCQESLTTLREQASLLESQAREAALAVYAETGNKKPADGVGIRVYQRLRYDVAEVMAWCKEHAPVFVIETLDKKPFEKAAPDMAGAPVIVEEEPTATLGKDLSAYL